MSVNSYNDFEKSMPTYSPKEGPRDWVFWDDFHELNMSTTAGLGRWTHLTTDAGNTATIDKTLSGGVLKLAFSSPTDEDVISLGANSGIIPGTFCKPGTPIRFEAKFQLADVSHNDWHLGLSIYDASMAASAPADWAGFRVLASEAAGEINLVTSKDSVVQMVDPITILNDATWVRAGFEFWPTTGNADSGKMYYWLHHNGTLSQGTLNVENTWPDDVWIAPLIQVQIEGTDEDIAYMDWIYAHAIRNDWTDGTG